MRIWSEGKTCMIHPSEAFPYPFLVCGNGHHQAHSNNADTVGGGVVVVEPLGTPSSYPQSGSHIPFRVNVFWLGICDFLCIFPENGWTGHRQPGKPSGDTHMCAVVNKLWMPRRLKKRRILLDTLRDHISHCFFVWLRRRRGHFSKFDSLQLLRLSCIVSVFRRTLEKREMEVVWFRSLFKSWMGPLNSSECMLQ